MRKKITLRGSSRFIVMIAAISFPIGAAFDTSTIFLERIPWYVGGILVFAIVLVGALFDMIGVSAAAANETPFHAMASKRVFGARRAIKIVRNAEKVSSICSDVVGDIAGVLSGAGALAVAVQLSRSIQAEGWAEEVMIILLTALVTALTVGVKAVGKTLAIQSSTRIILITSKIIDTVLLKKRPVRPNESKEQAH